MDNNISFGARFIKSVPIKKYSYENKLYIPTMVNIVEHNPLDLNDVRVMEDIAQDFGGDSYANNIAVDLRFLFNRLKKSNGAAPDDVRFFSLTQQKDKYEKLNLHNILGVTEISKLDDGITEIDYLQTHPRFLYPAGIKSTKGIGSAFLNYVKTISEIIKVNASPKAVLFYMKNGFERVTPEKRVFVWKKDL